MNKAEVYFVGEGLALSDPAEASNNPRPTPVFNRNKGKLLMGKSK